MFTITISKTQFVSFIVLVMFVICGKVCYNAGYDSGRLDSQKEIRKSESRAKELQTELNNLRDSINGRGYKRIENVYRMAM